MDTIKFCTGSKYTGLLEPITHVMSGSGTYTYPDGSIYCGNFKNGRFNGKGWLKLAEPYNMTFTGIFNDGRLVNVHQISFNDGLRFYDYDRDDERKETIFEKWIYCTTGERRYLRELFNGLAPVTDNEHFTAEPCQQLLREGHYDTAEGVYWPVSGFLNNIAWLPSPAVRFVECSKEAEWIKTHCRYGGNSYADCKKTNIGVPRHPICPEIIKNNLLAMQDIEREARKLIKDACACTLKDFKHLNLCEDLLRPPLDDSSSADRAECFLTQSNSSFGMESLNLSLKRNRIARKCTPASSTRTLDQKDSESNIWSLDLQGQSKTNFTTEKAATESEYFEAPEEAGEGKP